jgi:hypothetical protein
MNPTPNRKSTGRLWRIKSVWRFGSNVQIGLSERFGEERENGAQRKIVKRERSAHPLREELCRKYFQTDRITFGCDCAGPWERGPTAKRMKYFLHAGDSALLFSEDDHNTVAKGDALLIPPKRQSV